MFEMHYCFLCAIYGHTIDRNVTVNNLLSPSVDDVDHEGDDVQHQSDDSDDQTYAIQLIAHTQ
jgi:hypothetical protein